MRDLEAELKEAERAQIAANNKASAIRKDIEAMEMRCRKSLYVENNVPCKVGRLPNGKLAVHVWVKSASASEPNQLHIVEPVELNESGELIR